MSSDESNPFLRLVNRHYSAADIPDEPSVEEKIRQHEELELARWAEHLEACGCEPRSIDALTSARFDTDATRGMKAWLGSSKVFLLLLGARGAGKTVAACEALGLARKPVHFLGPNGPVASWSFASERGMFADATALCQASYHDAGRLLLERAGKVAVLVVDDLGVERMDGAGIWASAFDALIKRRESHRLRTVITANFHGRAGDSDKSSFQDRYGDRAYSRIKGDGMVIQCGNHDHRQDRKEQS
jgi:DNA replication protein DnaC